MCSLLLSFVYTGQAAAQGAGCPTPSFGPTVNYPVGNDPNFLATGDFNNDGKQDIVSSNYIGKSISILLGDGTGGFMPSNEFATGNSGAPESIATGDFNRDGDLDLVVANVSGDLSIWLGKGDGTFETPVSYPGIYTSVSVIAVDFNGDGKTDLALADQYQVYILLGNGDGSFAAPVPYSAGNSPVYIVSADFNNDSKTDLAVADRLDGIIILLGNGDGTFGAPTIITTMQIVYTLAAADLNNDGKMDLAVTYGVLNQTYISVLQGKGDGSFNAIVNYSASGNSGPTHPFIAISDYNNDGKLDLATTNNFGAVSNIAVLLNQGDSTFADPVFYNSNGYLATAVVACDFNSDGKPDLAIANGNYFGNVAVLLNTCDPDSDGDGVPDSQDCKPNDPTIYPGAKEIPDDSIDQDCDGYDLKTWYQDKDGDGFGNQDAVILANTQPQNYVKDSTDCNDNDATINPQTVWVLDGDGDGYYISSPVTQCTSPGSGYVIKSNQTAGDCNDADASVHGTKTFYADKDGDGYGAGNAFQFCVNTTPVGYSVNNSDCNDNDVSINPQTIWVLDADKDGYYTGNPVTQCTSPGTGYVVKTNQTAGDCNDKDAGVHAGINYYVDADKDGYGAGTAIQFCSSTVPAGYSTKNTDCNDKCATVHPGAADGYDGIDNDCDGQVDEDFFQFSIYDAKIYEGNSGQRYLYFTVSLNWIPCRTITVNYTTQNGTATAGSDYTAKSGTLTFYPGILLQTIAVPVIGDKVKEGDETFKVVLSNPYNATLYRSTATGTILNDDGGKSNRQTDGISPTTLIATGAGAAFIKLSPVPAHSILNVQLSGFEDKVMLQVYDANGKALIQVKGLTASSASIDVSKLASGTYLLTATDEKGNQKTERFVVSR